MKQLGAKSTSGPEAILLSTIKWWLDQQIFDLEKEITKSLEKAAPEDFTNKLDLRLGESLAKYFPVDSMVQNYWDLTGRNHAVKHIIKQAILAYKKEEDPFQKADWAKEFIRKTILSEFGSYVKSSGYLEQNAKAITAAKKKKPTQ